MNTNNVDHNIPNQNKEQAGSSNIVKSMAKNATISQRRCKQKFAVKEK